MANSHLKPQIQRSRVKTTPGGFPVLVLLSFTPVSPSTFLGFFKHVWWFSGSGQSLTHINKSISLHLVLLFSFRQKVLDSNTSVMLTVGNNCGCPRKKFWSIPGILNDAVRSYIFCNFKHFQEIWTGVGADT